MNRETFGAMDPFSSLGFAQINFDTVIRYSSVTLVSVLGSKGSALFLWNKVYGCQTTRDPLWVEAQAALMAIKRAK